MYKLKNIVKRGSAFAGAVGLLAGIGTSALPAFASADALNPLTDRSLTLSSSSPGWSFTDGSGNALYAPPNSGANGKKTGNTYTFRMSSTGKTVKGITFQYCTTPAGDCIAPGDDTQTLPTPRVDDASHTDLNIVTDSSQQEITDTDYATIASSLDKTPAADGTEGNFVLLHSNSAGSPTYAYNGGGASQDWTWEDATSVESPSAVTGKNNFMELTSANGQLLSGTVGDYFKIVFYGTDDNYITNPGSGAFFVRINTYDTDNDANFNSAHLIDGGVTVANVMNESITIQTKVLETMAFSVGVKDPDTYANSALANIGVSNHGQCSSLLMGDPSDPTVTGAANQAAATAAYNALPHNVLKLGDSTTEYSLSTTAAHTVDSYWRLSSNSSGGATVYYTGHTLTNTENDQITPMNDTTSGGTASVPGTEQFGLGIAQDGTASHFYVSGDTYGTAGTVGDFADFVDKGPTGVSGNPDPAYAHLPQLYPLSPATNYKNATAGTPAYAFNANADTYAQQIATENTDVVNCVTAKMRYIANIAATTPAGIYTTKVNYVASPQY
jgi:hypothetical protein